MMANITLIHYSHQKADSSKLKAAFPAQRSATQAFVFAAEYSPAMSCQSQQLGIGELSMAQKSHLPQSGCVIQQD